jgi:hypothetical protein
LGLQISDPHTSTDVGRELIWNKNLLFQCFSVNGDFSIKRSNPQQAKSPAFLDVDAIIA